MKSALIFGVTGQDGSYLAEFLLKKNYVVHGVKRRASSINTIRVDDIYLDLHDKKDKYFFLHYGDLSDSTSILNLIKKIQPNEIYNLAAQSHVAVSFELPEYTSNINALGALRILEAIRALKLEKKTKFYQAGTSEMFGGYNKIQKENTPFHPKSPYGTSKLFAHWITKNYRESYNIFAANGILFNHESPLRGETFVTKKIVNGLVNIKKKKLNCIYLGNIYAKRDWGHAIDYVEAIWKILQRKKADDFVISSGNQYSVKNFINITASHLGIKITWTGKGIKEKGYDQHGKCIIKIDKKYFRPNEVNTLLGNSSKARKQLNWKPKFNINKLIKDMINYEYFNDK